MYLNEEKALHKFKKHLVATEKLLTFMQEYPSGLKSHLKGGH